MARWLTSAGERTTEDLTHLPAEVREKIEADLAQRYPTPELCPENAGAVDLYLACQTQWRTGMGGPTGLDYTGVEASLRMGRVPRWQWPELFARLRVIELGVLSALQAMR